MEYEKGKLYKLAYEGIDKEEKFLGIYKGVNKNGTFVFVSENYGHMLLVGKADINECVLH